MTDATPDETEIEDGGAPALDIIGFVRRNPTVTLGSLLLLAIVLVAIFAPLIAPGDPQALGAQGTHARAKSWANQDNPADMPGLEAGQSRSQFAAPGDADQENRLRGGGRVHRLT